MDPRSFWRPREHPRFRGNNTREKRESPFRAAVRTVRENVGLHDSTLQAVRVVWTS
jgi:hypothetical protein